MKNFIASFLLFCGLALFAEELGTGLVLEPLELYSSLPTAGSLKKERRMLPAKVDLSDSMPTPGYQGKQGSCVAFSTAYTVRSYQELKERQGKGLVWDSLKTNSGINPKTVFSPAYVYNSLNKGLDNGITYFEALSFLTNHGVVPWENMPYDPNNFTRKPKKELEGIANQFLAKEFRKVQFQDLNELKGLLADGHPIMTGILISSNLLDLKPNEIYQSHSGKSMGGHAITLVGYDDSKKAFLFMNSWGEKWANDGFGWIDYTWYLKTARVGYILIDEVAPLALGRGEVAGNFSAEDFHESRRVRPPRDSFATQGSYSDQVVLTWTAVEGAVGYEIYRGFPQEDNFQKIGFASGTYFADTGVRSKVNYAYKIATIFESNISDLSSPAIVGFAAPIKSETPPKIMGVKASRGGFADRVRIEWQTIEKGVTGYQVFRWDPRFQTYRSVGKVKSNFFDDKTANRNGVVETYIVTGLNGNVSGIPSDAATGRTSLEQKPEAPTGILISHGVYPDKIQIRWKRVPSAKEYAIYRQDNKKWIPLGTTEKEEFWDESPGTEKRFYTIVARNKDNIWGEFSEYVVGYTDSRLGRSETGLNAPKNFHAILSGNNRDITLDWEPVQGAEEYTVWLRRAGEPKWIFWGRVEGQDRTSFLTSLPEKNVLYLFSVTAKRKEGAESNYSTLASIGYSEPKLAPIRRAFDTSSNLERIEGTWAGMVLDKSSRVKIVTMEISTVDENTIQVSIDKKKTYSGVVFQDSTEIELEGKVKIRIPNFSTLAVELKDKSIVGEKMELSFLRE